MATRKAISRRTLIDGGVFIAVSLICMAESYKLYTTANPYALAQDLFPGLYVFMLGAVLLISGIVYIAWNLHAPEEKAADEADATGTRVGPAVIIGILAGYALFIGFLGYASATFIFFCTAFWLFGVRNPFVIVGVSLLISATFYTIFVNYLVIIFPRGFLI